MTREPVKNCGGPSPSPVPASRGGDSWGDLPIEFRGGADVWIPGSWDAELGLSFWGTAQAKPWGGGEPGTDHGA